MKAQKLHLIKLEDTYFDHVMKGDKTFELRRNDREYEYGDYLIMREHLPGDKRLTGREILCQVNYTMEGFEGLKPGYILMGIKFLALLSRPPGTIILDD